MKFLFCFILISFCLALLSIFAEAISIGAGNLLFNYFSIFLCLAVTFINARWYLKTTFDLDI